MFCQKITSQWDEEDDSESGDEESGGDDEEELGFEGDEW
jgi:hypothetical protein